MSDSHSIDVIIPCIASIFLLLLFIALYRASDPVKGSRMKRAAVIAAAGSTLAVLLSSLTLVNFFLTEDSRPLSDLFAAGPLLFLPMVTLRFAALLRFFFTFYREQNLTT